MLPTRGQAAEVTASGTCGTDLAWVLTDDGVLTISGTGDMAYFSNSSAVPWKSVRDTIKSIVVEEGVESIGYYAFYSCGNVVDVELPNTLKKIESTAFYRCTSLTELVIPEGTRYIYDYAFYGCSNLKTISLPETLTSINNYAFANCTSLEEIELPAAVDWIEWGVFSGCSSLKSIVLPYGLQQIQESTFSKCTALESVVIPSSVHSILDYAFSNCTNLKQIVIPASVTSIKDSVFNNCTGLTNVIFRGNAPTFGGTQVFNGVTATCYYPANNETWTESVRTNYGGTLTWVNPDAFGDCGASGENVIWSISDQVLTITGQGEMANYEAENAPWFMHKDGVTKVVIGEGVTTVGNCAFYGFSELQNVELPGAVTMIGDDAFSGCTDLMEIDFPESVCAIGSYAFKDCDSITSVELPKLVTQVGEGLFYDCGSLNGVDLHDDITAIGAYAFYGCQFTQIQMPESLQDLGAGAFSNCKNLTGIVIPAGITAIEPELLYTCEALSEITVLGEITSIGSKAFSHCYALTEFDVPETVTSIGSYAFHYSNNLETVTLREGLQELEFGAFYSCHALTRIEIPESVQTISESAFQDCTALSEAVIPDSVEIIGDSAFQACPNLTTVTIGGGTATTIGLNAFNGDTSLTNLTLGEGVTSIGPYSFFKCTALADLVFPESLEQIEQYAFRDCTGLETVTFLGDAPEMDTTTFYSVTATCYYPANNATYTTEYLSSNYGGSLYWESEDYEIPVKCGDDITWEITEEQTLVLKGTGAMYDYSIGDVNYTPWYTQRESILKVEVDDGITHIGSDAFYETSSATQITIPDSVTTIGARAFAYSGIQAIDLPTGLTAIGEYAFKGAMLESIVLPSGLTEIPDGLCNFCNELKTVQFPASLKTIGSNAFSYCYELGDIVLPEGLVSIGEYAFSLCGAYSLYSEWFDANNFTSVTLPSTLKHIGANAFNYCESLTGITIPDGVTVLEESVFSHCTSITSITIPAYVTSIAPNAFNYCDALSTINFRWSSPEIAEKVFYQVNATCYYPSNNPDWTEDKLQDYGGTLVWVAQEMEEPEDGIGDGENPGDSDDSNTENSGGSDNSGDSEDTGDSNTPGSDNTEGGENSGGSGDNGDTELPGDTDNPGGDVDTYVFGIITQPEDQLVALNGSAVFSVEAVGSGLSYQWQYSNNGGVYWYDSSMSGNDTNTVTMIATEKRNGQQYRCVITDVYGNKCTSEIAMLTLNSGIVITVQPQNQTASVGDEVSFMVSATGNGLSYQWQYSNNGGVYWYDSSMSGNDTNTVIMIATEKRNGQQYRCVITDAAGNRCTTDVVTLSIGGPVLEILVQPVDQTAAVGQNVVFAVEATGENLTYQWQYSTKGVYWFNSGMTGNDTSELTVAVLAKRDGQQYRCVITDADGNTVASDVVTLTVGTVEELEIVLQPTDQTVAVGETAMFTVEAAGEGVCYQWQYSTDGIYWFDSGMTGNDTNELLVAALIKRDGQQYRCIITDSSGKQIISDVATLNIEK